MPEIKNSYNSISDYVNFDWQRDGKKELIEITFSGESWCISDDVIGEGSYANIHLAIATKFIDENFNQLLKDHKIMAVKSFKGSFQGNESAFNMYYQLHSAKYPIALQGNDLSKIRSSRNGRDYLLLPLFPGSLNVFYEEQFSIENSQKVPKYFSPVNSLVAIIACLRELSFFHRTNYAHLDIKLENFQYDPILEKANLIDPDFAIKITNPPSELNNRDKLHGSLAYQAPEIFESLVPKFNLSTDYYAMAGMIIELLGNIRYDVISKKTLSNFINPYNRKALSLARYEFTTNHLKKHFSKEEITHIESIINHLSDNNYAKRPENLNGAIEFFETLLEGWLSRHKIAHQEKMKPVLSQLTNRFFKNAPPEREEEYKMESSSENIFLKNTV